jgi:adenosylcobinamide kinase / adenosylcobinamide-phosphate guanylyltransferase
MLPRPDGRMPDYGDAFPETEVWLARIVLVTGGTRSGKSEFAIRLAEGLPGARAFLATCPVVDDEMAERIERHRMRRVEGDWRTFEEQVDVADVLASLTEYRVILVECLTLWVNNLFFYESDKAPVLDEARVRALVLEVLQACAPLEATVIFVTNEVGMGIAPDNSTARRWRDLVGACNQAAAAGAHEVFLVACGLPLRLKGPVGGANAPGGIHHVRPLP